MEFIGKRISILKKPDEVSVVILSSVEKRKTNLLLFWLIAWTLCGIAVLVEYINLQDQDVRITFTVWLAFWFYFEYTIGKAFMWRRSGKEKIKVKPGKLSIKREVNKKGKVAFYDIDTIKDFRLNEEKNSLINAMNNSYWSVAGETIAFDYYGKVIRFGLQLEERNAKELYRVLKYSLKEFENAG